MASRKKTHAQKLLEEIFVFYNCKTMAEAQEIYRKKYEVDKELEPKAVEDLQIHHPSF